MLTTKNRARSFEFFFGLAVVIFLAGCMPKGPKAMLEGDRLLQEGKFADAIPQLTTAIAELPQDKEKAVGWTRLGLAYHQTGDIPKAAQAYHQAIKLDRDIVDARYNLGCLQLEQGNGAAAIEVLTTYLTFQTQDPNGFLKLAQAHLLRAGQVTGREKTTQLEAARVNFDKSLKLVASAEAQNGLGMVAFQKGRTTDAIKLFQSALQAEPRFGAAMLNLAVAHHSFRDVSEHRLALKSYKDYLATNPSNSAEVQNVIRQLEQELNSTGRSTLPPPSASSTGTTSATVVATNEVKRPITRYKYLSPVRPAAGNRAEATRFFNAALEAQRGKRLEEAAASYRKAILADGSFYEAHYNLQLVELERGNLPAALSEAETALAITAGSVNARYNFALALDRSGFAQDAAMELEKILKVSPAETRAHLLLGSLYAQKLNDIPMAKSHFAKVLELEPQHAQAPAIRKWLGR